MKNKKLQELIESVVTTTNTEIVQEYTETKGRSSVTVGEFGITTTLNTHTLDDNESGRYDKSADRLRGQIYTDETNINALKKGEQKLEKSLGSAIEKEELKFIARIKKLKQEYLKKQVDLFKKLS